MRYEVELEGQTFVIDVEQGPEGRFLVKSEGEEARQVSAWRRGVAEWAIDEGRGPCSVGVHVDGERASVVVDGHPMSATVVDPQSKALSMAAGGAAGQMSTPMPGIVVRVLVEVGQAVTAGQVLVVVEAMKMENEFKAPISGVVSAIQAVPGTPVAAGAPLITLSPS